MGGPVRHAVIVVHGQGEGQLPGDQLALVANGIADVLENAGGRVERAFQLNGPAEGTLTVTRPGSTSPDDVFAFSEAFWARSLPAAPADAVAKWMLRLGPREALQVVRGWWRNAANDHIDDSDGGGAGSDYPARWWLRLTYYVELVLLTAVVWLVFLVSVILTPLLFALYAMAVPRGSRGLGVLSPVLRVLRSVDPFLRDTLGDAWRFVEDGAWSSNIRAVAGARLVAAYEDPSVSDVTIIAFSEGCAVVYDALAEGGVAGAAAAVAPRRLTLVTVGSGVNRNFGLSRMSRTSAYARRLSEEALDHRVTGVAPDGAIRPAATDAEKASLRARFYWVDIFARMDLVPGGAVRDEVLAVARVDPCQVKTRQVINEDDLLRDHFGYFHNADLVIPRLVRAVYGGEYPWNGADRWTAPRITPDRIRRRTRAVAFLQALRFVLAGAVASYFALLLALPALRDAIAADAGAAVGLDLGRLGEAITVLAALVAPLLVAWSLYRFVRGWWFDWL